MVLGTGCISIKKAYSDLPWDVFVCIGTISGIGTGLDVSGGGALIANAVLNLFGGKNASVVLLTVVIAVLTSVLHRISCQTTQQQQCFTPQSVYSNCIIAWNQSYSMGNRNRCLLKPCNSNIFRNSCKYADTSGRIQVSFDFVKNRWTVTYNTYCSCFYMQCGIPCSLRIGVS